MRCAQAEERSVLVRPGEAARVALTLTPLRPGGLAVTGLDWLLNGHAPGYRLFAERRARHRRTASKCARLLRMHPPWLLLCFGPVVCCGCVRPPALGALLQVHAEAV